MRSSIEATPSSFCLEYENLPRTIYLILKTQKTEMCLLQEQSQTFVAALDTQSLWMPLLKHFTYQYAGVEENYKSHFCLMKLLAVELLEGLNTMLLLL